VSREGKYVVFWAIYWAISAGLASIPFIAGALAFQFLPYSPDLAYGAWWLSLILIISAGYGAFSIVIGEEAKKKGYRWHLFFWLSIGLTPFLVGVIVTNLTTKTAAASVLPRVCLGCQRQLLPKARYCSACGQQSPLLVEASGSGLNPTDSHIEPRSSESARARNIIGGVGSLLGSLILTTFFLLALNLDVGTGLVNIQDLLYPQAVGIALAILGVILLQRGLKTPKNGNP
jgi:hypothetical protein